MDQIIEQLRTFFLNNQSFGTQLIETVIIIIVLLLLRRLFIQFIISRTDNQDQIYAWRKASEYFVLFFILLTVVTLWFNGFENVSTYLGLLSAGLAIALQDPLSNLVGWLYILTRGPFDVGDRIEVGDVAGDVIDIQLFRFSLLEIGNWVEAEQSTGRIVYVPNRDVFSKHVANYSSGISYIWNEIPVNITFESDWQLAKRLLEEVTQKHSLFPTPEEEAKIRRAAKRSNVRYPSLSPVVYTKVSGSGVILTLRYLCKPRRRRTSEQAIWEDILERFAEQQELDFAYDTQRVFYHPVEGKTLLTDHSEVSAPRSHMQGMERGQDTAVDSQKIQ